MQCTSPVFLAVQGVTVPCGKCRACRIARAREWSMRIVHEAESYSDSVFVTLTYGPQFLPPDGALDKPTLQRFVKRLRRAVEPRRIKYYGCGEYGEEYGRPHYHMILFGVSLAEHRVEVYRKLESYTVFAVLGGPLKEAWPFGFITMSDVCLDSARYVADYVHKDTRREVYGGLQPPFAIMSQGIGKSWAQNNLHSMWLHQGLRLRGVPVRAPRYYQRLLMESFGALKESASFVARCTAAKRGVVERERAKWQGNEFIGWDAEFGRHPVWVNAQRRRNIEARDALRERKL